MNDLSLMCMYWDELEDEGGVSYEYCKKDHRQCSCSGLKAECGNGKYASVVIEDDDNR